MATATVERPKAAFASRRYTLSDKFFTTALNEAMTDSLFSPVAVHEKEIVKLKPGFDTACWAYLPPHRIYIGTDLFEKRVLKEGMSESLQKKYIGNHYHHERGHALYTERDMALINKTLRSITAPFQVFNLFEDARMEDKYRREAEYAFEWLTMENLDFLPRPESLLFALIQAEGDVEVVKQGLKDWKAEPPPPAKDDGLAALLALFGRDSEETRTKLESLLPRVIYYYARIIETKGTMGLMPVINAWLDEFGRQPEMPKGGANGGMADLEHSAAMMTKPGYCEAFDTDAVPVKSDSKAEDKAPDGTPKKGTADVNHNAESSCGKVLSPHSSAVDMPRAQKLANKFLKFFAEKSRVISTLTPQRKISARHFAIGRSPYRKVEMTGRGVKNVFLEIDCSGSMGGRPMTEGKLLVTALSLLAQQGRITGHIALSAVHSSPCWEVFKFPVAQEVINRIQGNASAEGLEYTLRGNMELVKKADYVFVYTDAQITDKPIDKSYFHKFGVFTWGLYAGGDSSFLDELLKYFDKAIMRGNAEDLVDAMLAQHK